MALFENYERRIDKINGVLAQYGIGSVEECREMCKAKGFDPYEIAAGIQPICFENVRWAYCVGAAIAMKSGVKNAAEAAKMIGVGLQSFCLDGSVADDRKVGLGHGNLGAMLLSDDTKCFAFLAGHESFAAAEGVKVRFLQNETEIHIVHNTAVTIPAKKGFALSVFSMDNAADGVSIAGAQYNLDHAQITNTFPIGISNEFIDGNPVQISVQNGTLMIICIRAD